MEDKKQLDYKFIAMPTQLTLRLDNNLRIMLMTLIQVSSYEQDQAKKKGKKWDGYFKRSNKELKDETGYSKNLINATIETLYREKIIDVICAGKAKGDREKKNRYKVYFDRFKQYQQDSVYDCITDVDLKIETLDYKAKDFKLTYLKDDNTKVCETTFVDDNYSPGEHYNIDNIENEENVKNEENAENKNNLELNILSSNNNFKKNILSNDNKLINNQIKMMIDDFRFNSSRKQIDSNLIKINSYIDENLDKINSEDVESYRAMALNAAGKQYENIQ